MNNLLEKQKTEIYKKHSRKKRWQKVVSVLAAITVFTTTYSLILPAITLESPTCGQEEHTHDESCYEERSYLSCGLEEDPGHTHDESCYDENGNLICGQEERPGHIHTADCYSTERVLICEKEEHVHNESCYPEEEPKEDEQVTEPEQTQEAEPAQEPEEKEESEPEEPSGDPTADLESAAQWESTFAHLTLTGDWAKDVLAIADTQLGYTESARNFITDDGRAKGYTRYGAWYGDSYGDWCAMFVSFCQHYAGVDSSLMPMDANCPNWIETLSKEEWKLYRPAHGAYIPKPGDLIFFDWENDGESDHVGLVYELIGDTDGNPVQVKTIEGNSSDRVQYVQYALTDSGIMGYGNLPENPEKAAEKAKEEKSSDKTADQKTEESEKEVVPSVLTATTSNGVTVSMIAPKNSLPFPAEELTLSVSVINDKEAKELIETEASEDDGKNVHRKSVLFDIKLLHNGTEVEPKGPVSVSFAGIETPKDDARVFHVDEEAKQAKEVTASEQQDGTITAETDHFSVYGVTYTVDFHFGDYTCSILGKSEILLSELFVNLNIDGNATDVTNAVFSDPTLIAVEQMTDDWKLTSLKAFNTEETLTITFADGTELVIGVTDAPVNGVGENYVPNTAEVTALNISKITGTAPWDVNNNSGNDKDATNDVVRSFDTIFYNVGYTVNLVDKYNGLFSGYKKANLYIRAELPLAADKAVFDTAALSWMSDVHVEDNGNSQTLTAYYKMEAVDFDYIVPGTGTLKLAIQVKGLTNGSKIEPVFKVWLDDGDNMNHTALPTETIKPSATIVSSKANYNISLRPITHVAANLNPTTGNYTNGTPFGLLSNFGVYVSVKNDNPAKGLKGIFVDASKVSFRIRPTYYRSGQQVALGSYTGVWDYSLVDRSSVENGALGRTLLLAGTDIDTAKGKGVLPYSARLSNESELNSVYNSGSMTVTKQAGNWVNVTFTGIQSDLVFPTQSAGLANGTHESYDNGTYIIASGTVQLFSHTGNIWQQNQYLHGIYYTLNNTISVDDRAVADYDTSTTDNSLAYLLGQHASGTGTSFGVAPGYLGGAAAVNEKGEEYVYRVSAYHTPGSTVGLYGADWFVKFDGSVFEPSNTVVSSVGSNPNSGTLSHKVLYVAKSNGSNWTGTSELMGARMTNSSGFRVFSSMNALKNQLGQNAVCVGLWVEARSTTSIQDSSQQRNIHVDFGLQVKPSAVSDVSSYIHYESRVYSGFVNHSRENSTALPAAYLYRFNALYRGQANTFDNTSILVASSYFTNGQISPNGQLLSAPITYDRINNNEQIVTDSRSGMQVFIRGVSSKIKKTIAQHDDTGQPRILYMPDAGERSVDYVLAPQTLGSGPNTTVTIKDILPKGVTYVPGSSFIGGTYSQPADRKSHGTVTGGTNLTDNGTLSGIPTSVTTTGDVTLTITVKADGKTELEWILTNVAVSQEVPKIYYSAHIGDENNPLEDVKDGQQLTNQAEIVISGNQVLVSTENGNLSTATIQILKLDRSIIQKNTVTPEVDVNTPITYIIDYVNDTAVATGNINILDLLPYNGDLRGSSFHGSYTVDTVTVEQLNDAAGNYALDYTTDTSVQGHEDDLFNLSPVYAAATATVAGKVTTLTLPSGTSPTLLNIKGTNVGGYAKIRITVTLHPTGNKDGDSYGNDAAYNTPTIPAPVYAAPVYATVVQQKATLTISKTVIGSSTSSFPFEVLFTDANGDPVKIPEDTANPKRYEVEAASPYKVTFRLFGGNSVKLSGIPVGTKATITETAHDGYTVLIKDTTAGGTTLSNTDTAAVAVTTDKAVEVVNNPGVLLPSTGGPGNSLYIGSGAALLLFTFLFGFSLRRRRERRAKR